MQPFRSVMVPLDGGLLSEQALPLALGVAQRAGAQLVLVHVATAHDTLARAGPRAGEPPEPYLDALAARLRAEAQVAVATALLDARADCDGLHGPAHALARVLTEFAAAYHSGLIVMTTHGHSGLARLWLGSVADALLQSAELPLLLLRPTTPARQPSPAGFARILIPLDGSPLAERALGPALALGSPGHTCYTLLQLISPLLAEHTVPPYSVGLPNTDVELLMDAGRRYLARTAAGVGPAAQRVRTQLLVAEPAEAIVRVAREWGADLIAMATHGRGALGRTLLGSVADQVARGADVPVLLCRPESD